MEKYLLNMPGRLKNILTQEAKEQGFSLNGMLLFILWDWVKSNGLD